MQRWLIGAGVVAGAVLLAVLLVPSPDTGDAVHTPERKEHTVELRAPEKPFRLPRPMAAEEQASAQRNADNLHTPTTPTIRGPIPRNRRYQEQLATADLTLASSKRPWNALERALDSVHSEDSKRLREQLAAVDEKLGAFFQDPSGYEGLVEVQTKLLADLKRSGLLEKNPGVAAAFDQATQEMKRTSKQMKQP